MKLTFDFIKTGLYQGYIIAEYSAFFGRQAISEKALITCKAVYLFSEPN